MLREIRDDELIDGQFGYKYDRALISGAIVYHFIHIRQVFTVELDSFNNKISVGLMT